MKDHNGQTRVFIESDRFLRSETGLKILYSKIPKPNLLTSCYPFSSCAYYSLSQQESAFLHSCSKFFSSCSVAMISRCHASYCCWVTDPFFSPASIWSCTDFSCVSFSFVSETACCKSFCFCSSRVVFVGSNFRSLPTSFNWLWVFRISLLTPESALERPVVSPPISTRLFLLFCQP